MNKKGFTLIELSIVLVVIGLLISGILAARSMVNTAKVNRFIRELQQYGVASGNYYSNYKYFPGDSPIGTPAGDANELIDGSGACSGLYQLAESYQAFAHMSQIVPLGNKTYVPYSPVACGGTHTDQNMVGVVMPYTKVDSAAFSLGYDKMPILVEKYALTNYSFSFKIEPMDVLVLENKIGSQVDNSDSKFVGIGNPFGVGNCVNAALAPVLCSDSSAIFGDLRYYPEWQ
jgi:prepilin-type N-terminal cleavage/methylation domain-containing protein